jgi:hypothetical protein
MGTPSSLTNATTNAVTTTTHTHALSNIESALTISTGLTRSVNTITADLSTGKAGSQSAIGGTAASETLTLSSTVHGTKGKILFGTSAYDEVNNRLGVGTASPTTVLTIAGPMATALSTKTDSYVIQPTDSTIVMNVAIAKAVTLPTAVGITGRIYIIKNINVGVITVQVQGGVQTIDQDVSLPLNQWESITAQSDGANWIII